MNPNPMPRKRKHPPPAPSSLPLTRSRARSEKIRPNAHPTRPKTGKFKSLKQIHDDPASGISVKDLRARRVFSPASVREELEIIDREESTDLKHVGPNRGVQNNGTILSDNGGGTGGGAACNKLKRKRLYKAPYSFSYRRLLPYLTAVEKDDDYCFSRVEESDTAAVKGEETRELDDRKAGENVDVGRRNLSQTEGSAKDDGVEFVEECDQATPPDVDVFGKPKLDDVVGNDVSLNETMIRKNGGAVAEGFSVEQNGSNSKCAMVLNPCSRLKLFKTPNSVSYRRLLPFLLDIAKDSSRDHTINQYSKYEKELGQKPSTLVMASTPEDILVDKSTAEPNSGQLCLVDNEPSLRKPVLNSDHVSVDETKLSSPTSTLTSCNEENSKETFTASSQLEHVTSDRPTEMKQESPPTLSNGHQVTQMSTSLCGPVNCEIVSEDSGKLVQVESRKDCSALQAGFTKDEIKPISVSVVQDAVQIRGCDSLGDPVHGVRKGILKRNPRGCRGLCNCLNCATFRLQAERAFEFSKNQMQDAEEVAFELMKELADIRNLLENSGADANNQVVLRGDQVSEACMKALAMEELAKRRLSQMNEDLKFHCRKKSLERPRVAFASSVEEKNLHNGDLNGDSVRE